jgi:hypothetical protein
VRSVVAIPGDLLTRICWVVRLDLNLGHTETLGLEYAEIFASTFKDDVIFLIENP